MKCPCYIFIVLVAAVVAYCLYRIYRGPAEIGFPE